MKVWSFPNHSAQALAGDIRLLSGRSIPDCSMPNNGDKRPKPKGSSWRSSVVDERFSEIPVVVSFCDVDERFEGRIWEGFGEGKNSIAGLADVGPAWLFPIPCPFRRISAFSNALWYAQR